MIKSTGRRLRSCYKLALDLCGRRSAFWSFKFVFVFLYVHFIVLLPYVGRAQIFQQSFIASQASKDKHWLTQSCKDADLEIDEFMEQELGGDAEDSGEPHFPALVV